MEEKTHIFFFFFFFCSSTGWLPRKKVILTALLLVTVSGVLVLSTYTDLGRVSIATSSGRKWVSKMLASPGQGVVSTQLYPAATEGNCSDINRTVASRVCPVGKVISILMQLCRPCFFFFFISKIIDSISG